MRVRLSEPEKQFQEEAATWLRENIPSGERPPVGEAMCSFDKAWQRTQYDSGWAGVSWPTEYGGRGLSLTEQMLWYEQYALADAPHPGLMAIALGHAGPTLILSGTLEQREEHLDPILRGDEPWAQGFSEPNSGSDLASVRTRGRIEGDELIINGQKIWSTLAQYSDYYELLVRTDPESKRHHGLTWVMVALDSPGVDVRPITAMTGIQHYCEVFFNDVRVPLENVVGGVGEGWIA
jgi:alkylation response protein AidB-like acyl-CoA dehydrogenase